MKRLLTSSCDILWGLCQAQGAFPGTALAVVFCLVLLQLWSEHRLVGFLRGGSAGGYFDGTDLARGARGQGTQFNGHPWEFSVREGEKSTHQHFPAYEKARKLRSAQLCSSPTCRPADHSSRPVSATCEKGRRSLCGKATTENVSGAPDFR